MTLEKHHKDLEPQTLGEELLFAQARMSCFWYEARTQAGIADHIKSEFVRTWRERRTTRDGRPMFPNKAEALQAAFQDSRYKDAVGLQQMYDRWTMREAAVVTALAAICPKSVVGSPDWASAGGVRSEFREHLRTAYARRTA